MPRTRDQNRKTNEGTLPGPLNGLTAQQDRFVTEYMKKRDPQAAAIAAGYAPNNPAPAATRLLSNPTIAAEIRRREMLLQKKTHVTKQWLVEKLVCNLNRAMQIEEVTDQWGNFIGEYRYQGQVANKALELLGKLIGEFDARLKVEHSGEVQQTHTVSLSDLNLPVETLKLLLEAVRKRNQIVDGRPNPPTGDS